MKKIILPLILLCSLSTFAQKATIKTITVEPYKQLSYGAFFKGLSIKAEPYAEYIDGFTFEWGYTYSLKIKEIELANPPMDGSSVDYQLVKELSKTKVEDDYTFPLRLHYEVYLGPSDGEVTSPFELIEPGVYTYFEDVEVEVPEEFEAAFSEVLNNKQNKEGTFKVIGPNRIRMIGIK